MTTSLVTANQVRPAPMGPQRLQDEVEQLIMVIGRLSDVLLQEVVAVERRTVQSLQPLLEEKETLSTFYTRQMRHLRPYRDQLANLGEQVLDRLSAAADQLRTALEQNARVLRVAKIAHEKVMKAIGEAVALKTRPPVNYAKNGQYVTKARAGAPEMRPIALDQEI